MLKKTLLSLFAILVIGAAGYSMYYLYGKSVEEPITYETAEPFRTKIVKKTVATGSINPRKVIDMKSQVSGVVDELYVEAGEIVKKGDRIAKIKIIPNVVSLNNAEAQLKRAEISFNNAEENYKRQEQLFKKELVSEFDFKQAKLDFELQQQNLETARINLQLVKEGAAKESGNAANIVTATAEGMVLDVPVKEGNFVIESNTFNDGTTISTVADMQDMIFEGFVDESEVGKIKEGMFLSLKVGAIEDQLYDATLEYISPKGETKDGAIQFEIRAKIDVPDGSFLRAGYSANADIILQQKEDVLAIEEKNLIFEGDKIFVEVSEGANVFTKKEVKTGISDGIKIEITEGLSEGQKIKQL